MKPIVLLAICGALCAVSVGIGIHVTFQGHRATQVAPPPPPSPVVSITETRSYGANQVDYALVTMRHDGHLWVLAVRHGYSGTAPMHHPDCPCLKGGKQ